MLPTDVRYIFVHCSASAPEELKTFNDIKALHTAPPTQTFRWGGYVIAGKGWSDVAYHLVIERNGTGVVGRQLLVPGAHARGYNSMSVGICLIGGVNRKGKSEDNFTDMQKDMLTQTLHSYRLIFPMSKIKGHREVNPNKACPSFDVQKFLKSRNII